MSGTFFGGPWDPTELRGPLGHGAGHLERLFFPPLRAWDCPFYATFLTRPPGFHRPAPGGPLSVPPIPPLPATPAKGTLFRFFSDMTLYWAGAMARPFWGTQPFPFPSPEFGFPCPPSLYCTISPPTGHAPVCGAPTPCPTPKHPHWEAGLWGPAPSRPKVNGPFFYRRFIFLHTPLSLGCGLSTPRITCPAPRVGPLYAHPFPLFNLQCHLLIYPKPGFYPPPPRCFQNREKPPVRRRHP